MDLDTINPVYHIDEDTQSMIKKIEHLLTLIDITDDDKKRNLKIKSQVKSIHSSLAIEANSLSLKSVENIAKNKPVLGKKNKIQEVKNAIELYENMNEYNWKNENDFLSAHLLLMRYFNDDNGEYRNHGEEVQKNGKIIFMVPQSIEKCHLNRNVNFFIKFVLKTIKECLEKTTKKIKLNLTSDGVKYNLNKLVKSGILARIGPDNGGYWDITTKDIGESYD